jgi:hypothetical protein
MLVVSNCIFHKRRRKIMTLQSLVTFGKVRWRNQSISRKLLFVLMALIGVCLIGITPAGAAIISFSENPDETSNIVVATDISGARIATDPETAVVSVGDVTAIRTLIFQRQMTIIPFGQNTVEDGVTGVSDVLSLFSFLADGVVVGLQAVFLSDFEQISPPLGNFPAGVTNLPEDGNLQLLTPAAFRVTLPGLGNVNLAVSAQSDVVEVPGPIAGAGLPGLILASGGLLAWWRRRQLESTQARA